MIGLEEVRHNLRGAGHLAPSGSLEKGWDQVSGTCIKHHHGVPKGTWYPFCWRLLVRPGGAGKAFPRLPPPCPLPHPQFLPPPACKSLLHFHEPPVPVPDEGYYSGKCSTTRPSYTRESRHDERVGERACGEVGTFLGFLSWVGRPWRT